MFGIDTSELILIALVALVVIGPKDLPKAMRVVGYWVGRARGVARQFRSGFDAMVREAELEEMEKRWAAENERIMREHPVASGVDPAPDFGKLVDDPNDQAAPVSVEKPQLLPEPVTVESPDVAPAPDPVAPEADNASKANS